MAPRARALGVVGLIAMVVIGCEQRVAGVADRYGGPPAPVVVTSSDVAVGQSAEDLRIAHVPPDVIPDDALTELPSDAPIAALALPAGAVVTHQHLDTRGPGIGLEADLRAVPIEVEPSWGVVPGGFVDVWILGSGDVPALAVARQRPVLDVSEGTGRSTALVGLSADEVADLSDGLASGRVLLVHAPPDPARSDADGARP